MKFSIVTPTYNRDTFLRQTIESVLSQEGDFEIEYIVCDGGSTDNTIKIIKEYELLIKNNQFPIKCKKVEYKWISGKDNGMYDAINKGFSMATGDVYAWINSDDFYAPNAFHYVYMTLSTFPDIQWLGGITSYVKSDGKMYEYGRCLVYNQKWIELGIYGRNAYFIHQDNVFWKKELWNSIGGIDTKYKFAGDYYLWTKFAKTTSLWSLNKQISFFRKSENQLSNDMFKYRNEQKLISAEKGFTTLVVKLFFLIQSKRPNYLQPLMLLIYKVTFWKRNRYYVDINNSEHPVKVRTSKYTISPIKN